MEEHPQELAPALGGEETPSELAPVLGGAKAGPHKPVRDRSRLAGLEMYFARPRAHGYAPNLDGYALSAYVDRLLEPPQDE